MLFRLKNVGPTYQRMATTLLHNLVYKEVDVYMNDMVIKGLTWDDHLAKLELLFQRIQKYKL